jgi:hypothetical protein
LPLSERLSPSTTKVGCSALSEDDIFDLPESVCNFINPNIE